MTAADAARNAVPVTGAGTVNGSILRTMAGLVSREPERVRALFSEADIDPALADDPDARIPREGMIRLARVVGTHGVPEHGGLDAFRQFTPGIFDIVSVAMMTSKSLLAALEVLTEFSPLLDDTMRPEIRVSDNRVDLCVEVAAQPMPALVIDLGLGALMAMLRLLNGGRQVRLRKACLSYPRPTDLAAHAAILGNTEMIFDAPQDRLVFDRSELENRLMPASRHLGDIVTELMRARKATITGETLLSIQVRAVIADRLKRGVPTLPEVAETCGLAERSLQRGLQQEGVTFNGLLDETRNRLAHMRLKHSSLTLKEISYSLGYDEPRSFHRACMRWFGMTPLQYRNHKA